LNESVDISAYTYLAAARNKITNNLAVDPAVEAVDLAATELAIALALLLFNKIFLLPHLLQALTGLDNVICKPISTKRSSASTANT
jgi:hypothetical protein